MKNFTEIFNFLILNGKKLIIKPPHQRRQSGLKSGGSWIRVLKRIDFSRQIFRKISTFSGNLKKFIFFTQKLAIYSYFWANYCISLQKSPLSNILPVGLYDKM